MKPIVSNYLLFCWIICLPHLVLAAPIGEITWTDSFLSEEDWVPTDRLSFGYLTVPEDYDQPEGRSLQIAFVVIKAAQSPAAKDASMFFMGGWGNRTIKNIPYYRGHFLSYQRDLILYDYRGTGYSEPTLCRDLGTQVFENILANWTYEEFEANQKDLFEDCLDEMEAQGFDFNQYGTDNKARDGVLLAKALGYESYNLFGVSYGTKTILQFIRQSEVNIRSVILDSNCPLDYPINSGMTEDYAKSLDHVLQACEKDSACNKQYPKLREKLEGFLVSLDEKPLKIRLPKSRVAYLNRQEVNGVIHQLLYQEQTYGMMPFLLTKFSKRRKFIIQRIVRNLEEAVLDNYNAVGLVNYVYDHKPFQEIAADIARGSLKKYPAYHVFDGYQAYFLSDERFRTNTESIHHLRTDIPALILAGGVDPVTPTFYSKRLRPYFKNHHYVEFPETGHGVTDNWCGRNLAENFLNALKSPAEISCFEEIEAQRIVFDR